MASVTTSTVKVTVVPSAKIPVGLSSKVGFGVTFALALGTLYQAIVNKDAQATQTGVAGILTLVTTLGGRYAQAVAAINATAPTIQAVAAGTAPDDPAQEA